MHTAQTAHPDHYSVLLTSETTYKRQWANGVLAHLNKIELEPRPTQGENTTMILNPGTTAVEVELAHQDGTCWVGRGRGPNGGEEYVYTLTCAFDGANDVWIPINACVLVAVGPVSSGESTYDFAESPTEIAGTWGSENGGSGGSGLEEGKGDVRPGRWSHGRGRQG